MAKVWKKIGHTDKKYESGSFLSLQIPVTWPSSDCDQDQISALDNPKKGKTLENSYILVKLKARLLHSLPWKRNLIGLQIHSILKWCLK
eukprot:7682761-Ditylum_brightwellii.AAC.1